MATKFIQHDSIKALKKKLKDKYYIDIRDRIRALIMISKKYSYQEIADNLGFSIQWVKKLAGDYTKAGLQGLMPNPNTGAECFLTPDQIIELYQIILSGPPSDDPLSRYRVCDFQKIVKEKWDVEYSASGMHALLQRMKLSHVTTRPQNPKNDPAAMDLWKKKPKNLLTKKRKTIKALSSGSKMKNGSGKKESAIEFGQ